MGLLFAGLAGGMAGFGKGLAQVSEDEAKRQLEAERAAAEEMRQERLARLSNSLNEATQVKMAGINNENALMAQENAAVNAERLAQIKNTWDAEQAEREHNWEASDAITKSETDMSDFVNEKGQPLTEVELQMAKDAGEPVQSLDAYNKANEPMSEADKARLSETQARTAAYNLQKESLLQQRQDAETRKNTEDYIRSARKIDEDLQGGKPVSPASIDRLNQLNSKHDLGFDPVAIGKVVVTPEVPAVTGGMFGWGSKPKVEAVTVPGLVSASVTQPTVDNGATIPDTLSTVASTTYTQKPLTKTDYSAALSAKLGGSPTKSVSVVDTTSGGDVDLGYDPTVPIEPPEGIVKRGVRSTVGAIGDIIAPPPKSREGLAAAIDSEVTNGRLPVGAGVAITSLAAKYPQLTVQELIDMYRRNISNAPRRAY